MKKKLVTVISLIILSGGIYTTFAAKPCKTDSDCKKGQHCSAGTCHEACRV